MPSEDTYHRQNPQVNTGLISHRVTGKKPARQMNQSVLRLADRLGVDADELAKRIPEDTLRRTKYPVIEHVNEDGTRSFDHDAGIHEGRISAPRI